MNTTTYRLQAELGKFGSLPSDIFVLPFLGVCEAQLSSWIGDIKSRGAILAPSFAFIDPYGFSISMDLMNEILAPRKRAGTVISWLESGAQGERSSTPLGDNDP
jgi:hypothetical protein